VLVDVAGWEVIEAADESMSVSVTVIVDDESQVRVVGKFRRSLDVHHDMVIKSAWTVAAMKTGAIRTDQMYLAERSGDESQGKTVCALAWLGATYSAHQYAASQKGTVCESQYGTRF
jgi:uncharacterized protein GlcG (DUF336 family)